MSKDSDRLIGIYKGADGIKTSVPGYNSITKTPNGPVSEFVPETQAPEGQPDDVWSVDVSDAPPSTPPSNN